MLTSFQPSARTLGTLPHGALTGPHFFRADFSVLQRTRLTEYQTLNSARVFNPL